MTRCILFVLILLQYFLVRHLRIELVNNAFKSKNCKQPGGKSYRRYKDSIKVRRVSVPGVNLGFNSWKCGLAYTEWHMLIGP